MSSYVKSFASISSCPFRSSSRRSARCSSLSDSEPSSAGGSSAGASSASGAAVSSSFSSSGTFSSSSGAPLSAFWALARMDFPMSPPICFSTTFCAWFLTAFLTCRFSSLTLPCSYRLMNVASSG